MLRFRSALYERLTKNVQETLVHLYLRLNGYFVSGLVIQRLRLS